MQSSMRKREETKSVIGRSRRNKFQNVSSKVNAYVSTVTKTLAGSQSGSAGHVTKVCITETKHVRSNDSIPNRNEPVRYRDNGAVRVDDMAESVHRQLTELSCK
jgi:hypothetical protein